MTPYIFNSLLIPKITLHEFSFPDKHQHPFKLEIHHEIIHFNTQDITTAFLNRALLNPYFKFKCNINLELQKIKNLLANLSAHVLRTGYPTFNENNLFHDTASGP